MIFSRMHLRGKMNLLIVLPLAALLAVAAPFVFMQVDSAQSAAATADAARDAQALSNLIWQLQRERLLTAGFLVSPGDDGVSLGQQQQISAAAAQSAQDTLGPDSSDELAGALTRVGSLAELRAAALHRGTSVDSVARAYHAVIQALIDALELVPQRTSDAEGTRQLTALAALLNANEQSALKGMALIAAAASPLTGTSLLTDATSRAEQFVESFVQQADVDEADQVVQVELGADAKQVDAVAARLPEVRTSYQITQFAAQALAAVDALSELRRGVQDRVTGEIADAAAGRAATARDTALGVTAGTALLLVLITVLTIGLSRSIANPLRRLTRAATDVADLAGAELVRVGDAEDAPDEQLPRLAEIEVTSGDEVGELALAFNRVQTSAAQLVERQIVSRRNVNMMFTNVAQRTRNLVSRQLAVVDELEREEENAPRLARLYQLDHLATRLRRTAENLLVLAGSQDAPRIKRPTLLVTLIRAALTEIEDYRRVQLRAISEIVVHASAASDVMLIFAELLENATTFSPPESTVEVVAELSGVDGSCRISIVDHGIGMSTQRLQEANQRLVERERLEITPTNVLGLFVVGRLARRHGLIARLRPTNGGGTTAELTIPPALFQPGGSVSALAIAAETGRADLSPGSGQPKELPWSLGAYPMLPASVGGFDWFASPPPNGGLPQPAYAGRRDDSSYGRTATSARPAIPAQRQPNGTVAGVASVYSGESRGVARAPGLGSPPPALPASVSPPPMLPPPMLPARSSPPPSPPPPTWPPAGPIGQAPGALDAIWPGGALPSRPAGPIQPSAGNGSEPAGLTRRVPGAHLAPGLRDRDRRPARHAQAEADWRARDPDNERSAFDSYTAAWNRADASPAPPYPAPGIPKEDNP
jgi:signal transduction histidine kinase